MQPIIPMIILFEECLPMVIYWALGDVMRALLAYRTFMVFQVGYTFSQESYEISHFAYQISLTHIASLELRKIAEVVDEHHTLRALLVNMDIINMNTLKDLPSFLLDIENMRGCKTIDNTKSSMTSANAKLTKSTRSSEPIQEDTRKQCLCDHLNFFTESSI